MGHSSSSWTPTSMEVRRVLGDVDIAAESDMVVGHNDHTNEVISISMVRGVDGD